MEPIKIRKLDEVNTQKKIDFFIQNQIHLINYFQPTELDYQIFLECMEIYLEKDENYFPRYKEFYTSIQHQHLEEGLKGFYKAQKKLNLLSSNIVDDYELAIKTRLQHMDFFGIEEVNGYTKADYQNLLQNALKTTFVEDKSVEVDDEEARIKKYFNFSDFNKEEFELIFQKALKSIEERKYSSGDLEHFEKGSYIILSFLDGIPTKISSTDQPAKWVTENQEGDSFGVFSANKLYIKELKVKLCLYYPTIKAYSAMIQVTNKLYANLKQAKKVYQFLNGLNMIHLKQILEINNIEQHFVGGATIIEKAVLDHYIQEFIKDR